MTVEALEMKIGRFSLDIIRRMLPKMTFTRDESIGISGGWQITVKFLVVVLYYAISDYTLYGRRPY